MKTIINSDFLDVLNITLQILVNRRLICCQFVIFSRTMKINFLFPVLFKISSFLQFDVRYFPNSPHRLPKFFVKMSLGIEILICWLYLVLYFQIQANFLQSSLFIIEHNTKEILTKNIT